jgi:hypothetical protein
VQETWEGGTLDLTSVQPSTSGTWAWVKVGIDPSDNTAVAVAGSEVSTGTDLEIGDLDAIDFTSYIPCGAVKVREDDTVLSAITRYADAREWFNPIPQVLNDLGDVNVTTPADGDLLAYDDGNSEWVNIGEDVYIKADGSVPLTADWDAGDTFSILIDRVRARNGAGLLLEDDGGNGLTILDGGNATFSGTVSLADLLSIIGATNAQIVINGAAGSSRSFVFQSGGSQRWSFAGANATAESGSNVGSDMTLVRFSDAGTSLGSAFFVKRSTGFLGLNTGTPATQLDVNGTITANGLDVNGTITADELDVNGTITATSSGTVINAHIPSSESGFVKISNDTTGSTANDGFDLGIDSSERAVVWNRENTNLRFATNATERMTLTNIGRLGHGVATPQLWEHSHDGTSGQARGTVTNASGTATVIIPNGAGDVTVALDFRSLINVGGTTQVVAAGGGGITPGNQVTVFSSGGNTWALRVNADGSVDFRRTAGSGTAIATLDLQWQ